MTLIDALTKLRTIGKSQMWIAEQIGVKQSAISRLENGEQTSIEFSCGLKLIKLAENERAIGKSDKSLDC